MDRLKGKVVGQVMLVELNQWPTDLVLEVLALGAQGYSHFVGGRDSWGIVGKCRKLEGNSFEKHKLTDEQEELLLKDLFHQRHKHFEQSMHFNYTDTNGEECVIIMHPGPISVD